MASPEIETLSAALARLPGLGPRSARRAVLHLLKKRETALALTEAAQQVLSDGAPLWNKAQAEVEALLGEEGARNLRALLHDL